MSYATIPARLAKLANLSDFARVSNIPRRTLERIKNEGIGRSKMATLETIRKALSEYRPAKKT